jgi:hypothetical protein
MSDFDILTLPERIEQAAQLLSNLLQLRDANRADFKLSETAVRHLNEVHALNSRLLQRQNHNAFLSVSLAGERAREFHVALGWVFDCITSLQSASAHFPDHCGVGAGEIEPRMAIHAFTDMMEKQCGVMNALIINEDHIQVDPS